MEFRSYYDLTKETFSDYIGFADESGDHGVNIINPENPIFTLVFCVFKHSDYLIAKQEITNFKLKFWGHDLVILHSYDIRKTKGEFSFLRDQKRNDFFQYCLTETIQKIPFWIIATSIDKRYLRETTDLGGLYLHAFHFCLFSLYDFLKEKNERHNITNVIFESRGNAEDKALDSSFRRSSVPCKLDLKFANKKTNSIGLQIADLVAHPISRHKMKPNQPNRAFDVIKTKFYGSSEYYEKNLYVLQENEKPQ